MEKSKEHDRENWDLEIRPKTSLLDIELKAVWRYRDLVALFVRRDFAAQYQQTILGPLWHFIQPALTTILFVVVFGRIAKIPTDGISPILFYLSGLTVWNYFALCLTNISTTFTSNAHIFGKVYFPRLVLPLSIVISNTVRFGIQFLLLLSMIVWYGFHGEPIQFGLNWLFIPALVAIVGGIGLGLGIIISSLTTKYRDLTVLLTFAVQMGMYVTPIIYPVSFLDSKGYGWLMKLNPLSAIVESFRYSIFGKGTFNLDQLTYSFLFMIVVLAIGLISFSRTEKTFMDTV